ncbi:MAG: hypothetical protein ACK57W_10660, partial [Flavobacteriales bacterium]
MVEPFMATSQSPHTGSVTSLSHLSFLCILSAVDEQPYLTFNHKTILMTPQTDRFRKKLFFVVIVCSIIPSSLIHSQTQNYFGIDQTSLKIKKLRLLDMDLDGDADLIFLNLDKQRIECQENLGEGLFSPLITLARLNGTYHNAEFGNFIGGPAPDILLHGPNAERTFLAGSGRFSVMAH